ncbi:hypothetical protein TB2_008907 [Malus domestica]
MSLTVIDDMVEALGYSGRFMNYYYKIPNIDLSNGLKPIQSDSDVQSMCNFVPNDKVIKMYIEELKTEEAVTQKQQFMKSMEVCGPSKLVIEEISSSEGVVGPIAVKPIRSRGLLAIEALEVDDCCTSQLVQTCATEVGEINAYSRNGQRTYEGPEENKGKYMAKVKGEDTQVEEWDIEVGVGDGDTQVEEGDTEVGDEDVGEGDVRMRDVELFFDVPISFKGNVEEENEEVAQENDSDFEKSEYGSDDDNPRVFQV